ncbi:MAG: asparagine synthase C-terminal domain-containing protein, partial [Myxococcota bacterium]
YDDLRPARAERSLDEDAASVRRLTEHSIDEQLRGRSTVFLSGGLDSSIIAAELAARSPGTCHAYSIHFGPRYPNELEFAREVARRSRLQHHEVELSPKRFIPKLRRAIWHLDDPIGDPITVPNFLLAERVARDGFDTVFNGEGGDPLFGGPKNLTMMLQHWYGGVARGPEFRERAYLRSYRRAYELIGPLLTPDLTRGFDVDEVLETPLRPFLRDTKEPAFLNRLMRINMTLKGANLILPKVDRMLGAHGLRIASPLFDARLLRASLAMNPRHKLARGIEKVVLKHAWSNVLPLRVLERPKSGMRVPVHYWFKREARRYIRALLSRKSVRAAGWFNVEAVEKLLRYELSGQGRFGIRLWMLLTLELWRRLVLEREPI